MTRIIALIAWALLALTLPAAPARAHASLIEATPADGQVLREAPKVVRLRFNEPVSPLVVRLFGTSGEIARSLQVRTIDERIEVDLPEGLAQGSYALSYRVSSADGHPVGGSIGFSVGNSSGAVAAVERNKAVVRIALADPPCHVRGAVRGSGRRLLSRLAGRRRPSAARSLVMTITIAAGIAATVLALGYQGLDALGASLQSFWAQTVWGTAMSTAFGVTAVLAVLALCTSLASFISYRAPCRSSASAGSASRSPRAAMPASPGRTG